MCRIHGSVFAKPVLGGCCRVTEACAGNEYKGKGGGMITDGLSAIFTCLSISPRRVSEESTCAETSACAVSSGVSYS